MAYLRSVFVLLLASSLALQRLSVASSSSSLSSLEEEEDEEEDAAAPLHPASDLPLVDLVESPDSRYDPRLSDLNAETLRHLLGADFDPRYMSVAQPAPPRDAAAAMYGLEAQDAHNATAPSKQFSRRQMALLRAEKRGGVLLLPKGKMPKEVKRLRLRLVVLPDGRRLRARGNRKLRRTLRQFLWAHSYCPVVFAWKDLGRRFWPRWLREGHCLQRRASCSFPEGMRCKPSRGAAVTLLRWHCKDWTRAEYCRWIHVKYPLVTACACSC